MDLIFNESTQMWEEKKEPFAVIEVGAEEDFNRLQELVARAKAAEKQRDEARQDCAVAERNHMIEVERRKAAEARAEKAKEIAMEFCDRRRAQCRAILRKLPP